jgi:uncharacterized protein YndB with AHSA1/START domain
MAGFPHHLDRTVVIRARPATVFEFFRNPDDWAAWWGPGSTIDARPGGRLLIRHPNGIEVTGEVVEIQPPQRFVFTYGYGSGSPIPAGGSLVTIRLARHPAGTLVRLTHEFSEERTRDEHVQGWRFQLSLFANVVAAKNHGGAASTIDRWFEAWGKADSASRERTIFEITAPDVGFRDRFSSISGIDDLTGHLAAVHRFMPGMALERRGGIRQCQGHVLADWIARTPDGGELGAGTNLFVFDADGRISDVTGFWTDTPARSGE